MASLESRIIYLYWKDTSQKFTGRKKRNALLVSNFMVLLILENMKRDVLQPIISLKLNLLSKIVTLM